MIFGKELTLQEIQKVQLAILEQVDTFCKQNKLQYFLTGGTLLGAVRHQGFIPWDDDIDIAMPRPEYERFIKLGINGIGHRYQITSFENKNYHNRLYIKVVDPDYLCAEKYYSQKELVFLGIDVFPIDGVPNTKKDLLKYLYRIRTLRRAFILSQSAFGQGSTLLRRLVKSGPILVCKCLGGNYFYKKICKLIACFPYTDSDYAGIIIGYYGKKEILSISVYNTPVLVKFEGKEYPAPSDFKKYLTQLYGNYLLPPSPEMRRPHHSYKVYRRVTGRNPIAKPDSCHIP